MAIYISERTIAIIVPAIHCDACHTCLNVVRELSGLKLEKVPPDTNRARGMGYGAEGLFVIPGIPITEEEASRCALERGWKREQIHGTTMDFCPGCQNK